MKYIYSILSLIFLTFLSCKDNDTPDVPFMEMNLKEKTINVSDLGSKEVVRINTNVSDLQILPCGDTNNSWLNFSINEDSKFTYLLTIDIKENRETKTRKTSLVVKGTGVNNDTINIVQLGTTPDILTNVSFKYLSNKKQVFSIEIISNIDYIQNNTSEWLSLNKSSSSRGNMIAKNYIYNITENTDLFTRRDTIVISAKDNPFIVKIPVEQKGAEIDDVILPDRKIQISNVEMIQGSVYYNQKPELTIDGSLDTYYGSGDSENADKPIIFDYEMDEKVDRVDYIILHQSKYATVRNQLTKGKIEYKRRNSDEWLSAGNFEEKNIIPQIRINTSIVDPYKIRLTLERTEQRLLQFAEFECYKIGDEGNFDLDNDLKYFDDKVFSKLKQTTTVDDLNNLTHPMVRAIAKELLDKTYSTEFRSRIYKSCKDPNIVGKELTIGKRSICDNPTGVFFKKDKKYIVFVGDEIGTDEIKLYIKDWRENGGQQTLSLKSGLNTIKASTDGMGYIQYWTEYDMDIQKTVNVHICYGIEIGFWDVRAGHDNEYWKQILQKAVATAEKENIPNVMMDVCGEQVQLVNTVKAFNTYCLDDIKSVMKTHDELMTIEYTVMGLMKNNAVPRNRMLGVRSWGGNPNWNGTSANYPNSEETMLNPSEFRNNIWLFGHEFGHGNQVQQMKGAGWAEVTNNIYSQHCMYLMNNKQCRLEHFEYIRKDYADRIIGDRFNAYLNDAMVKGKTYLTHEGEKTTNPERPQDGEFYKYDSFVALAPLWQLSLFFMFTEDTEWYKPDFWGDVHWAAIKNVEGTDPNNYGQRYVDFMKRSMEMANMNLVMFFEKMGLLREINMKVQDYGSAKQITITKDMVEEVKNFGKGKPEPPTTEINYISGNTVDIYRKKLSMSGTYNLGVTDGDKSKTISHTVWKNAVAFETYNAEGKMIEVCIAGTGCTDNSSTFVRYPDGATGIKAVSWDGKREWVCGR